MGQSHKRPFPSSLDIRFLSFFLPLMQFAMAVHLGFSLFFWSHTPREGGKGQEREKGGRKQGGLRTPLFATQTLLPPLSFLTTPPSQLGRETAVKKKGRQAGKGRGRRTTTEGDGKKGFGKRRKKKKSWGNRRRGERGEGEDGLEEVCGGEGSEGQHQGGGERREGGKSHQKLLSSFLLLLLLIATTKESQPPWSADSDQRRDGKGRPSVSRPLCLPLPPSAPFYETPLPPALNGPSSSSPPASCLSSSSSISSGHEVDRREGKRPPTSSSPLFLRCQRT